MRRLRQDRRLRFWIVASIIAGLVLGLMTDVIRLGPSGVSLSADAVLVTQEILRIPDGDTIWDYYYLVVTISNRVSDPSIQPYEADLTLRTDASAGTLGHWPPREDAEEFALTFSDVDRTFRFPAGIVAYREPSPGEAQWTARGESIGKSRPIFRGAASFLLEIRIDEGVTPRLSSVVTVTWYYHSAVQAYPVASRTILA